MKYFVFFFLCCVALAAAAPQLVIPGYVGPAIGPLGSTVVAGPSVVNGLTGFYGGRLIAPGVGGLIL